VNWWELLGGGGVGGLLVGILVYRAAKRSNKTTERVASQNELQLRFEGSIELQKMIQNTVDAAVNKALEEPNRQITEMRVEFQAVTRLLDTTKDVIRRYIQRLYFWDENGRRGKMPTPSREDSQLLDIVDIEYDTLGRTRIDELIEEAKAHEHDEDIQQ